MVGIGGLAGLELRRPADVPMMQATDFGSWCFRKRISERDGQWDGLFPDRAWNGRKGSGEKNRVQEVAIQNRGTRGLDNREFTQASIPRNPETSHPRPCLFEVHRLVGIRPLGLDAPLDRCKVPLDARV
jgi:hypothetical protein